MSRKHGQQLSQAPVGAVAKAERCEYHYINKDLDKWVGSFVTSLKIETAFMIKYRYLVMSLIVNSFIEDQ